MSDKARFSAYQTVKRIFNGAFSNLVSVDNSLEGLDRAFAETIVLGVVERRLTLEYILSKFLNKETDNGVVILLMTGVYQIFYMDKVPQSAACDETVKIAKKIFSKGNVGLVNAVLRNICRNKERIVEEITNAPKYIKYSIDKELFELLESQYPESICEICESFLKKSPTFLRVNTLKSDALKVSSLTDGAIIGNTTVKCENSVKAIKTLSSGEFYIQGFASQKAIKLLNAKPFETVIDVCACPGGKSLGAAIDMANNGKIFSFDLHGNKLPLITKSAEKLGITIIETYKQDARQTKDELIGKADKVICDVPCSGTGVMGTKPEIKYKSPSNFKGLYKTQREIISSASKYLKIGGEMVYSTCSINKIENEEVVREFITDNKNFKLISETTILPFNEEYEGFYMAKIKRES